MFEDSTFESTGKIRTRSRGWMIATFLFNGSVLVTLILIPLIYPEALPRQVLAFLLTAPAPPPTPPPVTAEPQRVSHGASEMDGTRVFLPPMIPTTIGHLDPEQVPSGQVSLDSGDGPGYPATGVFTNHRVVPVVRGEAKGPTRVSSGVMEGSVFYKPAPLYPAIAKAAGIGGTVVLQATISKNGTIENLRVVSGPAMLQQSAMDAVKTWRYRPYLLNGEPVEVETTVNVVFAMGR
jgi:periplasmic protein TonB